MIRPVAALLTLAGVLLASEAHAQRVLYPRQAYPVAPGTVTYSSGYSGMAPAPAPAPARAYTYSYYTRSPLPARTYVSYGTDDFPFYGAPYGHPYDPWTWPGMSGPYYGLSRYYDPPVK